MISLQLSWWTLIGDYHLKTQVKIDIRYLKIVGTGHGFTSSSIRFNIPENQWPELHELWPGGSRIMADLEPVPGDEVSGAAFYVKREGSPRISSDQRNGSCLSRTWRYYLSCRCVTLSVQGTKRLCHVILLQNVEAVSNCGAGGRRQK